MAAAADDDDAANAIQNITAATAGREAVHSARQPPRGKKRTSIPPARGYTCLLLVYFSRRPNQARRRT